MNFNFLSSSVPKLLAKHFKNIVFFGLNYSLHLRKPPHDDRCNGLKYDMLMNRYMLTLVDTLDTLIVFKEYDKFEDAVKHVIRGLSFDTDITVNLFEANIRILG